MARQFTATDAVREQVPLLVGLMGASGSGKTYSALRLATGIQSVVGGDIYGVDTEAGRMKHYADRFRFKHVPFAPPFGSRDYLEVLRWAIAQGARTVVVDSMSHEHAGEGGYLDAHAKETERLSGGDAGKAERVKMLAWQKPSGARQALINGLLQLNANFVFCFRAREKAKPGPGGKVIDMGFMPIAGDEFIYEMTLNALLMPGANGFPTWRSENVGERQMIKPAAQFAEIFAEPRALDEAVGADLARWAQGDSATAPARPAEDSPRPAAARAAPTLETRTTAAKAALSKAETETALDRAWDLTAGLRDDLGAADSPLLDDLDVALRTARAAIRERSQEPARG